MKSCISRTAAAAALCLGLAHQAHAVCDWAAVSDPDIGNIAYPDTSAIYWVAALPALPGSSLRIDGQYPDARYFSFNVYDPMIRPVDAVADRELKPVAGAHNPFVDGDDQWGDRYVARIVIGDAPTSKADNTLYTGQFRPPGGLPETPNPMLTIIYRIYIPADADHPEGGVPLPKLTLELPGETGQELPLERCGPFTDSPLQSSPLNELAKESDVPDEYLGNANLPFIKDEPEFRKFYGLPNAFGYFADNALQGKLPDNPVTGAPDGGGFLSNVHNAYLFGSFERANGNVYVVRGKAPTHRDDPRLDESGQTGEEQLRYWSICTNEIVTQRFVDCHADRDWVLDADGYFTLVVSDPQDRPDNAYPEYGVNWLPWGAYPDSLLIYRHMLPNAQFAESIQNVPFGAALQDSMGEYAPQASYCNRSTIEQVPLQPVDDGTNSKGPGKGQGRNSDRGRPDGDSSGAVPADILAACRQPETQ